MNNIGRPDGIERRHIHEAHGAGLRGQPLGVAGLGVLLAAAVFGAFGEEARLTGAGDGVELTVEGPVRIRSGEFFEMRFTIQTEREIRDAVLRIDEDVWHDVTINTLIPQSSEEGFRDGSFELRFGAMRPGSRLVVKIDGQINPKYPPGHNQGAIALVDGPTTLASLDYSMRVFP